MRAEPTPSGSVELRDYLAVLRRQLVLIVAVTLLGAGAAATWTFRRTPVYESTASVLVRAITTNAFDPGQRVDQQLNMFNQRQLAQSEPVAAVAARSLQATATPAQLLEHVEVDVPANSQILRVRYRDTVPDTARRGADAFAKAYLAFREADARAQAKASQTSLLKDVARLNRQVAAAEKVIRSPRATSSDRQAAQLTSLNDRLQPLNVQLNGFLSLDYTPGTLIAAATLAVALAETGKDVLLVSADLRRPRVHRFFGLDNTSGLSDLLTDGATADNGQPWSVAPHLWVLPSGPPPDRPSALMDSDAMRRFLKEQRDQFDFLVLDCPPALVVADALALAPLADAVLVVADARAGDREAVSRMKEELEQVGGRIVGAVLNRSRQAGRSAYYYAEARTD